VVTNGVMPKQGKPEEGVNGNAQIGKEKNKIGTEGDLQMGVVGYEKKVSAKRYLMKVGDNRQTLTGRSIRPTLKEEKT